MTLRSSVSAAEREVHGKTDRFLDLLVGFGLPRYQHRLTSDRGVYETTGRNGHWTSDGVSWGRVVPSGGHRHGRLYLDEDETAVIENPGVVFESGPTSSQPDGATMLNLQYPQHFGGAGFVVAIEMIEVADGGANNSDSRLDDVE